MEEFFADHTPCHDCARGRVRLHDDTILMSLQYDVTESLLLVSWVLDTFKTSLELVDVLDHASQLVLNLRFSHLFV